MAAHGQTKAKVAKAAKASPRREASGKKKDEKSFSKFEECVRVAAGKCDKNSKPIGVNSLTATGATQPSSHASCAPSAVGSMASTIPMQQMVPVYFPNPVGSQASQQTETWFNRMIVLARKLSWLQSWTDAEYALLDSGSGLTSCPIHYADDLPLLPRPVNLPI